MSKFVKLSVIVKYTSVKIFDTIQMKRNIYGGTFSSMTDDITAPSVYPKYTTLPRSPNFQLSIPSSCCILTLQAGRMPRSMDIISIAAKSTLKYRLTIWGSRDGGR